MTFVVLLPCLIHLPPASVAAAQQQEEASTRLAHRIRVRLPINTKVSENVQRTLSDIVQKAPLAVRPEDRPLVVLEFDTSSGKTGRGSERTACYDLAESLVSAQMNRIETVAYIPAAETLMLDADPDAAKTSGSLMGHAVIVAIAANRLAMAPGTSIGKAGVDSEKINKVERSMYELIAESRLTLPLPMVMCMLEPYRELSRVTQPGKGPIYVDADELSQLQATQEIEKVDTVSKAGQPLLASAEQLSSFRLIELMPTSKNDLADMLGVNMSALDTDLATSEERKAFQIPVPYKLDDRAANWIFENVNDKIKEGFNLMILTIDDVEAEPDACIELSRRIAELDGRDLKTVAFVRQSARGPVGVLALACDQIIMAPDANLGGFGANIEQELDKQEIERLTPLVKDVAAAAETNWSIMMTMIDPRIVLTSYRELVLRDGEMKKGGRVRLYSDDELLTLKNPDAWSPIEPYTMTEGLEAATAEKLSLAVLVAEDIGQVEAFYFLEESPELVELRASEKALDSFARFLRRPLVSMFLLMGAFIFFSKEMSAPGLGVPGFISLICITLYFWAMSLGGNAQWFEILMFFVGAGALALEVFVIPGFGIFGIGGILLIGVSLILSAQTFFLPSTVAEVKQLPYSLLPVLGAGLGFVVGIWTLSKTIPNSWYFRKFMINTSTGEETGLDDKDPEAMVDWSFLQDAKGETITRLNPAGKVRVKGKVYDVISTGQLIEKGQRIVVVEALGNRIVVQAESSG